MFGGLPTDTSIVGSPPLRANCGSFGSISPLKMKKSFPRKQLTCAKLPVTENLTGDSPAKSAKRPTVDPVRSVAKTSGPHSDVSSRDIRPNV
jgi:hypothetical protein